MQKTHKQSSSIIVFNNVFQFLRVFSVVSLLLLEQHVSCGQLAHNILGSAVDLGSSIPGTPGRDYKTLSKIPDSDFNCVGKADGGLYADVSLGCQAFHICKTEERNRMSKHSFLCPNGTVFNQELFICDWWFNFDCSKAEGLYSVNEGPYLKPSESPPMPSSRLTLLPAPPLAISSIFKDVESFDTKEKDVYVSSLPLRVDSKKPPFSLPIITSDFIKSLPPVTQPPLPLILRRNEFKVFSAVDPLNISVHIIKPPLRQNMTTSTTTTTATTTTPTPATVSIIKALPSKFGKSSNSYGFVLPIYDRTPSPSLPSESPPNLLDDHSVSPSFHFLRSLRPRSNFRGNAPLNPHFNSLFQPVSRAKKAPIIQSIFHPIRPLSTTMPPIHKIYSYKILNPKPAFQKEKYPIQSVHTERRKSVEPKLERDNKSICKSHDCHETDIQPSHVHVITHENLRATPSHQNNDHDSSTTGSSKFPHFPNVMNRSPKKLKLHSKFPHFPFKSEHHTKSSSIVTLVSSSVKEVVDASSFQNHHPPKDLHNESSDAQKFELQVPKPVDNMHLSFDPESASGITLSFPGINHHYFSALPVIDSKIRPPTYAPSYAMAAHHRPFRRRSLLRKFNARASRHEVKELPPSYLLRPRQQPSTAKKALIVKELPKIPHRRYSLPRGPSKAIESSLYKEFDTLYRT